MSPDTSVGPTQLGIYDVLEKIAEGGMGTVYKCCHRVSNEIVAIKVIAANTAKNPVLLQRFEREFLSAKVIEHPNIVRALDYSASGPHPFLVMEFVDGESVGQRIERDRAIPEAEAIQIIVQISEGLQRAHKQGLVHRDVKPDNILVNREGVAKLADMGLVKDAEADLNLTKTGRGLGTPHYMAPEQFRNAKGVDIRCDIYSLGATLYAMVTGVIPFDNSNPLDCWMKKIRNEFPTPKELNGAVSDRVDWAIRRSMSAEPMQRPSTCREFIEDLTGQSRVTGPVAVRTAANDLWYLVYKDELGQTHTVKGSTEAIRNALGDGLLGDASTIVVGRSKTGQFQPVHAMAEFRDLLVAPIALPQPGGRSSGQYPKASGSVRRSADAETYNFGSTPTPAPGASGRYSAANQVVLPTADELHDPHAETTQYTPPSAKRTTSREKQSKKPTAKPGFDWTPLLMVAVAFASAAIGYWLLTK